MSKIFIYLFCFLFINNLFSQNAQADFDKVNANLMAAENLHMEIEYKVYANHFTKTPKEISYGVLKQKGNKIYQSIANIQAIINDKITVHLDTAERLLVVSDPVKLAEQKKEALQIDTKDILNKCKSVNYREITKTLGMYSLEYKDNIDMDFDRCDLYIDKTTFFITKMVLYYNQEMDVEDDAVNGKKETPRLEITYTKIDAKAKLKDSEFDEKLFIQRSGNKIVAAAQFKGFKIIDNRFYTKSK